MEKYLPLIYSANINYDPLVNVDYTETFTRSADSTNEGTSTSNSNSSGLTINSDTPQKQVNKEEILEGKYASSTSANESELNDSTNTNTSGVTNEEYTKNVKGNSGVSATAQKMVEQFRENIIPIDSEIIKELNILFMGLY